MQKIAAKLVKVMAECAYIQKNGTNDFHRYKYATAADVLEKVNSFLVKHGIAVTAQTELIDLREVLNHKGNAERLATVKTTLTLIDSESGECVSCSGIGGGQDPGDKAAMKACTASIKYAYMLTLAMATGDDPEADTGVDERMTGEVRPKLPDAPPGCSDCGATITPGVLRVSTTIYKRPLCMACQEKQAKGNRKTA